MIEWWQLILALISALGIREVIAKMIDRKATHAAVDKVKIETKANEVTILREVLVEVRADSADKTVRIERLEDRMAKLEERERHQLTRAAVHEAWDQMSFALLMQMNPNHPPPPPLIDRINELTSPPPPMSPPEEKP